MSRTYPFTDYGAKGDGVHDDWFAIQLALQACVAAGGGLLKIPAGTYRITKPIVRTGLNVPIAIRGDGSNVSVVLVDQPKGSVSALELSFNQDDWRQPWGLSLESVGFHAIGSAGTAIKVSYGRPEVTQDHRQPSVTMRDVTVTSDDRGSFSNGIYIESAWNLALTDVYLSGRDPGGNWDALSGIGLELAGMCVNSHITNLKCNFWQEGFACHTTTGPNPEGLFFANCSFVAVQRGVSIRGNPEHASAPRMSTLTWQGGLIELRVGGVEGICAAFHLDRVWTALINGCQMIAEAIPTDRHTYGVLLEQCHGVVVSSNDINAFTYAVHTAGPCKAISSHGNTFTNVEKQNIFPDGSVGCRAYGNVCVNNAPFDWAADTKANKLGFV